jgi:hypothetical protein
VTPWPVTASARIVRLALASAGALEALGGPRLGLDARSLQARLTVTGEALGRGYGHPTQAAWEAGARLLDAGTGVRRLAPSGPVAISERAPPLRTDTTYAGKAAAWLLKALGTVALPPEAAKGPVVFWMTKSAPPLPAPDLAREGRLPVAVQRWLGPP